VGSITPGSGGGAATARSSGRQAAGVRADQLRYRDAGILVANTDFGTGSSREQAVWALIDYGIRCVLAASFGDIFANNVVNHGLLLIREDPAELAEARPAIDAAPGTRIRVELDAQTWRVDGREAALRDRAGPQAAAAAGSRRDRPDSAIS
jgi:3-isopropylmalate/(R)-2-methylmalate dehydratase small subunit